MDIVDRVIVTVPMDRRVAMYYTVDFDFVGVTEATLTIESLSQKALILF